MQTGWTIILIKKLKKKFFPCVMRSTKAYTSLYVSLYMNRSNYDGMTDYDNSDGGNGRWRTRGWSPSVLHSHISSTFFFPLILSLFNVSFCLKATTGFIYLLFKFQVDRKKTLRMMRATTLTFRNKIKTYPTWLTLRNKIK
jgi:hypothetical protein